MVYLTDDQKARLERVARDREVSEAELIRAAIDGYTRAVSPPRPRLPLLEQVVAPDLAERVDEALEGFGTR